MFNVMFWGTYDTGKPRNRILQQALRENGIRVFECHCQIWSAVEDKSQLGCSLALIIRLVSWIAAYPMLIWRFMRSPKPDLVLIGYLGLVDILVIFPFARLRRIPIVWDNYISLYDTVIEDRKFLSRKHPISWVLFLAEWLGTRWADLVLVDTNANAEHLASTYCIDRKKFRRVFVGAETTTFYPAAPGHHREDGCQAFTVLYYGQFIPLHGIRTIIAAMKLCESKSIQWRLIGDGQDGPMARELLSASGVTHFTWTAWVPYPELIHEIRAADVCLGIFGKSGKALRVIPNKVYQAVAAGKPVVTADTPAIREFLSPSDCVLLIPPGDPDALAAAIVELSINRARLAKTNCANFTDSISPKSIGRDLVPILKELSAQHSSSEF